MKAVLSIFVLVISVAANAASVTSASYDGRTDEIVVKLRYGGCALETFTPTWGGCKETYPAQISVTLDDSQDNCEALATGTVRIAAPSGCRPAHVSVTTARSARRSSASVFVPEAVE